MIDAQISMNKLLKSLRKKLAQIAESEAKLKNRGNAEMAGPDIEHYLSVFRDALNKNGATNKYSDTSVGYHWCGAFVYYCCLKAGYNIPPKPISSFRYTLAAVPAWHHWAFAEGIFHESQENGEIGDIVLFNYVYENKPLDHIGIVIEVYSDSISSAEGNNNNQTGLFQRSFDNIAGFIKLPDIAEQVH
jgi:hypothetical protein